MPPSFANCKVDCIVRIRVTFCKIPLSLSDSEENKGFGYVAFAQKDDAEKAIKQITSLNNRKLVVKFADKKPKKPKRKKDFGLKKDDEGTSENAFMCICCCLGEYNVAI